ncbi:MAG TPA: ABC transporter permease [Candidatus Hydrogenedentes bacterium]|nr:ABC transporter permease [Candidatus Hydrogenedentota bacterium]
MAHTFYSDSHQRRLWRVFPDVFQYRGLLFDLVWKDLRVRYRNAMMGLLWAVLQPLLLTLVLTFVFTYIIPLRISETGDGRVLDRAPFFLCGLIPWQFFSASLGVATTSLLANRDLVKKVYFPRELIPIAAELNCLVNFVIGFALLLIVRVALGGALGAALLWTPFIFLIQFVLQVGLGLLLSCAEVHFRDTHYIVEIALVFAFYMTPVIYHLDAVSSRLGSTSFLFRLYLANPVAGLVAAYREAIFYNQSPDLGLLLWPALTAAVLLVFGGAVFRRHAPVLADYI